MKIVGIVCSPRRGSNTETAVKEALAAAREQGAETELLTVVDRQLGFCDACAACLKTQRCKYKDGITDLWDAVLAADGVIFGTPTYFWGMSAQAKAIIDRSYAFRGTRKLRNKVAGVIVVARRAGAANVFSQFTSFFSVQRMISSAAAIPQGNEGAILPSERGGGAIVVAGDKGDALKDTQGMAECRALGAAVALTIRTLKDRHVL
jgi:multimeric flavodoxin WrbA